MNSSPGKELDSDSSENLSKSYNESNNEEQAMYYTGLGFVQEDDESSCSDKDSLDCEEKQSISVFKIPMGELSPHRLVKLECEEVDERVLRSEEKVKRHEDRGEEKRVKPDYLERYQNGTIEFINE